MLKKKQQTCLIRRKKTADGNMDLHSEMKSTGHANYMGKYIRYSSYLNILKEN